MRRFHPLIKVDSLTIATLTERTGIAPEPSADGKPHGMREPEAAALQHAPDDPFSGVVAAMLADKPNLFAWELRSNVLVYEGYMPGDILIVDLNAEPVAGRVVCAQIYDWNNRNGTETVFRLYQPPFLLASGPTPEARRPRLLSDTGSVAIKGMVIATLRPR